MGEEESKLATEFSTKSGSEAHNVSYIFKTFSFFRNPLSQEMDFKLMLDTDSATREEISTLFKSRIPLASRWTSL